VRALESSSIFGNATTVEPCQCAVRHGDQRRVQQHVWRPGYFPRHTGGQHFDHHAFLAGRLGRSILRNQR